MHDVGDVVMLCADAGGRWPVDDRSAACVVFSPPYNVGISYDGDPSGDVMPWPDYRALARAVMAEAARVLITPGGRVWVNVVPSVPEEPLPASEHSGQTSAGRVSLLEIWLSAGLEVGLSFRDVITWVTLGRGPGAAWGSFRTPSGPNLRGEWEAVIAFSSGPWSRPTPPDRKGWRDSEGDDDEWPRLVSNVWQIKPEADRTHPAPFPIELPSRCIRLSSYPGELVVDPFAGSGTTLLAARALSRHAVGLDRSQVYVDQANDRLNGAVPMFGALDGGGGGG